jgi:hypothetical protein
MIKVAIFGSSSFLGWTKGFEIKSISGSNPDQSLFGKARYHLLENRRIRNLANWADVAYCEFLSEIAIKASYVSPKPLIMRIHRAELDKPDRIERMNWDNVTTIIAVSEHYAGLIRDLVPKHVTVVRIPPGVDETKWPYQPNNTGKICAWGMPIRRKRIYGLMLTLAGHYPLYVGGYSAEDRINRDVNERLRLGHILEPDVTFPEWQSDKEFYIHNALDESFGIAIAEAMLSGIIPLVHRIPCILEFVPEKLTYLHGNELLDLLSDLKQMSTGEKDLMKKEHRRLILEKYTYSTVHESHKQLFEDYIQKL